MNRVMLLGVPLDPVSPDEAVESIEQMLRSGGRHHVMTPNSEMLVAASRNPAFTDLLSRTALNLPDSAGLLLMARLTGQHLPHRVTGVDTVMHLCAGLRDSTVFLLGAAPGVAEHARDVLQRANPHLKVVGTFAGSPRNEDAQKIVSMIRDCSPDLLLVAFGAPQQDLWIDAHLKDLPSVKVAMGVGGTFDFIAGKRSRAPQWMQAVGLEWLYRLILEPRRIGRIITAVVVFPLLVVIKRNR